MRDAIEAMTIFLKYLDNDNARSPFNCEHDELWIMDVDAEEVSPDDLARLDELGFFVDEDAFKSYRFGSA